MVIITKYPNLRCCRLSNRSGVRLKEGEELGNEDRDERQHSGLVECAMKEYNERSV